MLLLLPPLRLRCRFSITMLRRYRCYRTETAAARIRCAMRMLDARAAAMRRCCATRDFARARLLRCRSRGACHFAPPRHACRACANAFTRYARRETLRTRHDALFTKLLFCAIENMPAACAPLRRFYCAFARYARRLRYVIVVLICLRFMPLRCAA